MRRDRLRAVRKGARQQRSSAGGRLEVRLLGGFDVRYDDRPIAGFESQKARALFAYLVVHRHQPLSRDHLAELFWPERDEDSSRQNLRQAIYNIRSAFPKGESAVLASDYQSIQLDPNLDCWLDVKAFEDAYRRGIANGGTDPYQLATAARLYNGDLLAGFLVKGSAAFDDWLIAEQERLREAAIEALRSLVEGYLARGDLRVGIQYARRLVAVDPISEEAHRYLMRLYALSGRRSRALAQYEELRKLLRGELDVEPLRETEDLYRSILLEKLEPQPGEEEEKPLGPLIPLVGRAPAFAFLRERWDAARAGRSRLTLIEGETGVGKTRLVKSFIDSVTSQQAPPVLRAQGLEAALGVGYRMFVDLLSDAASAFPDRAEAAMAAGPARLAGALLRLAQDPLEAAEREGDVAAPEAAFTRQDLFDAVRAFLAGFATRGADPAPVIVLLDDLQWADPGSLELLEDLAVRPLAAPVWIVATLGPGDGRSRPPLPRLARHGDAGGVDRLRLERLPAEAVAEIAVSLVGDTAARDLVDFLAHHGEGLPLAIAELINFLWDEGGLVPEGPARWFLRGAAEPPPGLERGEIGALVQRRVRRLPASTQRLLSLAAVIGARFDPEILGLAANEHAAVVDTALEILIERWLVRQAFRHWIYPRRPRDLALWASGARKGSFDFAHAAILRALLAELPFARRRAMHAQVAEVLERRYGEYNPALSETLAHHWENAGRSERALGYYELAAERAAGVVATATALDYCARAEQALRGLRHAPGRDLRATRTRLHRLGARLETGKSHGAPRRSRPAGSPPARRAAVSRTPRPR